MREVTALLAVILIASSAVVIQWTDDSSGEMCLVHFDYLPRGEYYCPTHIGQPILRENVQFLIDMGTWHLENGDPWDPDAPITGDTTITIDVRPDPVPIPDPPAPAPPSPDDPVKPSPRVIESDNPQIDYVTIITPFALLFGLLVVLFAIGIKSKK